MSDSFSDLGRDINDAVQRILSSDGVEELKKTIHSALDQVDTDVRNTMDMSRKQMKQHFHTTSFQSWDPSEFHETGYHGGGYTRKRQPHPYMAPPRQRRETDRTPMNQKQPVAGFRPVSYAPAVKTKGRAAGIWQILVGAIAGVPTGVFSVLLAIELLMMFDRDMVPVAVLCGVLFGLSIGFLTTGIAKRRQLRRFDQYQAVIHGRSYCTIKELAAATGNTEGFVRKDIRKMLRRQLFPFGYFDEQETCLILDQETYRQYLLTQKQAQSRRKEVQEKPEETSDAPQTTALEEMLEEGSRYIRQIRDINVALPEEEISRKLDHLEEVTSKIFHYVEQHPEKNTQIRKFMCYYLPTTLKLMEAYRDLELNGVKTQEVCKTEQEIKSALDNINQAFENLFNDLVQDDLLDLTSDIAALKTMLAQEGLTAGSDFDHRMLK